MSFGVSLIGTSRRRQTQTKEEVAGANIEAARRAEEISVLQVCKVDDDLLNLFLLAIREWFYYSKEEVKKRERSFIEKIQSNVRTNDYSNQI